jgi:hypothetical protein
MPANLMGIDVGFSKTRRTTGIAFLEGDHLTLERVGTAWEGRKAKIPDGFQPSVIAIDGPLLPLGTDLNVRRHVESLFVRAPFHNRCRPGLSHHGVGLELRQASGETYAQLNPSHLPCWESRWRSPGGRVNSECLGVLMVEETVGVANLSVVAARWLYDKMVTTGRLQLLPSKT